MAAFLSLADLLALAGHLDDGPGETARDRFRRFVSTRVNDVVGIRELLDESLNLLGEQNARARQDLVAGLGRFLGFHVVFGHYGESEHSFAPPVVWQSPRGVHLAVDVRAERTVHTDVDGLVRAMEQLASHGVDGSWYGLVVITPLYVMRHSLEQTLAGRSDGRVRSISLESLLWLADLSDTNRLEHDEVLRLLTSSPGADFMIDLMRRLAESSAVPKSGPNPAASQRVSPAVAARPRLAIVSRAEPGHRRCWVAVLTPDATDDPDHIVRQVIRRRQLLGVSGDGDTHAEAQVGDVVCLVVPDRGVVGHAVFDTAIEEPASVVRGGDRFGAVYRLTEVAIFDAARPVPESCETRRILDTLPPATGAVLRRISRAEFDALTRTLPDDRPAASI